MPKVKTHSGAAKRFKVLKNGTLKYTKAYRRHLLTSKTTKRKRNLRRKGYIVKGDLLRIKHLLPY